MANVIFTDVQSSLSLTSVWNCHTVNLGGGTFVYKIVRGPTGSSESRTFNVSIPQGAYVKRAWLSMTTNSPAGGAAYKMAAGYYIPPSGIVELDRSYFQPSTTSYEVLFSFKSNGVIYEDYAEHRAQLHITDPTLNIEYIPDGEADDDIEVVPDYSGTSDNDPSDGRFFLPRLLDGSFVEKARLQPDDIGIDLSLTPLSTAHMHLPPDQPEVKLHDFAELFAPSGSVGVYRVNEVNTVYGIGGGQELQLEHALTTLADSLAMKVPAMSGPVSTIVATLLDAQDRKLWVLGDCEVPVDYEMVYEHTYDDILKTLMKLFSLLPTGYALEFNTRRLPFVLHIRALPEDAFCECRLSRNLTSASVTMDDSELCTRLYPFGDGEGTDRINLSGLTGQEYVDADTIDTWGIISRQITQEDISDAVTLQAFADRYIERHKNPMLSVELNAVDLYAATGVEIDRFRLGRMCRLPLNDYGVMLYERVIAKRYGNVYRNPHDVRVTLANKSKGLADELAELTREATSSKLLGGTVKTEELTASVPGIYIEAPFGQVIPIKGYGNVLSVKLTYTCTIAGTAEKVGCRVTVDGTRLPDNADKDGVVELLPYLKKDSNGIPTEGDHTLELSPKTSVGIEHNVKTRILIKTVEK